MDIKELETWIKTTEGIKWLDTQKEGLIRKNEQLIGELKSAGGGVSELTQRVTDLQKQLDDKQAELKKALLFNPLDKLLKDNGCFEILIPQISRELQEIYDFTIDGNAGDTTGKVKNEAEAQALPLGVIVDTFLKSESGRQFVNPASLKTQVISTTLDVKGGDPPCKPLEGKTGIELAQMSDSEFQTAIQQTMR
jgi:hypothetical protein